jgi:hypothetical protein
MSWKLVVTFMHKITPILTLCCALVFFALGSFSLAASVKGEIDLKFKGERMSVELQEVSLRVILKELEREKGIWFKGDESLLEETVSTRFEDLPLQEGLTRILFRINHTFVFDQNEKLVGLYILDRKQPGSAMGRDAGVVTEEPVASESVLPHGRPETKLRKTTRDRASKPPFKTFPFAPPEDSETETSDTPFTETPAPSEVPFADPFGVPFQPQEEEGL